MWVFCLYVCRCTVCLPGTHRGQKSPNPRVQKLQTAAKANLELMLLCLHIASTGITTVTALSVLRLTLNSSSCSAPANNYDYRWAKADSTASSQTSPLWFLSLRNNYHHLTCNASDLLVYFLLEYKFCSMLVSDLKRMPLYHAQLLFQKWMKTEMNSFSFGLSESTSFAQGWANCTRSSLNSSLTQSRVSILNSQFPLWRLFAFFQSLWMLVFQAGCNPAPVWSWCSLPGNWKVQGRFGSLILIISKSPTTSLIFWRDRSWPDVCNRKGGGQMYIWSWSSKPQAVSFRFKNEHPKFLSRLEFLSLSRWG